MMEPLIILAQTQNYVIQTGESFKVKNEYLTQTLSYNSLPEICLIGVPLCILRNAQFYSIYFIAV